MIREGDDVLVTEQEAPQREFQLPGGGIDPGEGALRALHRECLEETGWRIRVLRRLGAFQRFAYLPEYDLWARKVCHIYLARPVLRHGEPPRGRPSGDLDADRDGRSTCSPSRATAPSCAGWRTLADRCLDSLRTAWELKGNKR